MGRLCMCRRSHLPGWWTPRLLGLDCWPWLCLSPVILIIVFQGGFSGKGTALKGRSDADLVVFLNNLSSFEDQLNQRGEFIREIQKQLCALQLVGLIGVKFEVQSSWWPNPRALSFTLSSSRLQQEVQFDVLPAYDVLGKALGASAPLSILSLIFFLCVYVRVHVWGCSHVCRSMHMFAGVGKDQRPVLDVGYLGAAFAERLTWVGFAGPPWWLWQYALGSVGCEL